MTNITQSSETVPTDHDFFIPVTLLGGHEKVHSCALPDTGASCNLIAVNELSRFHKYKPVRRPVPPETEISSAHGKDMAPLGIVTLTLKIGSKHYRCQFIVCPILLSGIILGRKSMSSMNITISLKDNKIHIGKNSVSPSHVPPHMPLTCNHTIHLAPGEAKQLAARPKKKIKVNIPRFLTPMSRFEHIMYPSFIDLLCRKQVQIEVENTSNKPITIQRGCVIGKLEPIPKDDMYLPLTMNSLFQITEHPELLDTLLPFEQSHVRSILKKNNSSSSKKKPKEEIKIYG